MKKLFTLPMVVLITFSVFAQAPQKISYQAVIRNASNALVTSHVVGMRISISQSSAGGTVVYTETQTPTTNSNGLVNIEIGGGPGFNNINWANNPYFIKTETDPTGGTNYTITGTSQILSIPYSLYTNEAANGFTSVYSTGEKRPVLNMSDGNIGLEAAPDSWNKLNINGNVNITPGTKSTYGVNLTLDAKPQAGGVGYGIFSLSNGASEGGGKLLIKNDNVSSTFVMDNNGHTGINNLNPAHSLDVTGDVNFTGLLLRNGSPFSGANSQWTTSGTNIYYNSGNVGIGTNNPSNPLSVSTANNLGIYGESTSASASSAGIKGYASNIDATNYGVIGSSASRFGTGVLGDATSTEGTNYGVVGRNVAAGGGGVYGNATCTWGVGFGVKGEVASANAYSGYFTGGKFYVKGEVDVNNNKIIGVADPINDKDATNKSYVDNNSGKHTIGESYGGGIVYYVYDNGKHGLIAATADQSTGVVWTNTAFQSTVSNAVRDGVNGGIANTERIIIQAGAGSYAAQLCANYKGGNYADWYLPSKYELNLLYLQKAVVGGFAGNCYLSSTENDYFTACIQWFDVGAQDINRKDHTGYVRAIRAF